MKLTQKYDENGNLNIFKKLKEEEKLYKSARTKLLVSNKIIQIERKIINWDTPKECKLIITVPFGFNINIITALFMKNKNYYKSFAKLSYTIKDNDFILTITSGSKRCSYCKGFLEYLDKQLSQELILVNDCCDEWLPLLKEKLSEDEFLRILEEIRKKRLEYFSNDTSKYKNLVFERDRFKCCCCGTDGKKEYVRKNGKTMKNPLQIHHIKYNEDSPDSLITLCSVCHFLLHLRMYKKTGIWSSKTEDMK